MKIGTIISFLNILFSLLSTDFRLEDRIDTLLNIKINKMQDHRNKSKKVYIEQLVFKKSENLNKQNLIFEIYDRMKEIYGSKQITFIKLQLEKKTYSFTKSCKIIIELIEKVQNLQENIHSYIPKGIIQTEFQYIKDILNQDFKKALLHDTTKNNENTYDFCLFVNHCPNIDFKKTLFDFYTLFHKILSNECSSYHINFVISDIDDGKKKQFFNYPKYYQIYQKFRTHYICGCGNQNYYDLKKYSNTSFPYMIISEHSEAAIKNKHTSIKRYNEVQYFKHDKNKMQYLSKIFSMFHFTYTCEIDLNDQEYLKGDQNVIKCDSNSMITDLTVNKITLKMHTCEDDHCYDKKIYFKKLSCVLKDTTKTFFLVKDFGDDDTSVRDFFITNIKNLEKICNTTSGKIDKGINHELLSTNEYISLLETTTLSQFLLYDNLESILTHLNYNTRFSKYNFCHRNIGFFNGRCTAIHLTFRPNTKRFSSIPYDQLKEFFIKRNPNIKEISKFSFSFYENKDINKFYGVFDSNIARKYIKELYFNINVDKLNLNDGIKIRIKIDESYQDFYIFLKIYIPNKKELVQQFYNIITKLDNGIIDICDEVLYNKYKEIIYLKKDNVKKYLESFLTQLEKELKLPNLSTINFTTKTYGNVPDIWINKSDIVNFLIEKPLNDLTELFFHILFTNILFESHTDQTLNGITIIDFIFTFRSIRWDKDFDRIFDRFHLCCLTGIKDMIIHYNFVSKISEFFSSLGIKNIMQFWEQFNNQTIDKLSEIFISEYFDFFDGLPENDKAMINDIFKSIFITIVKNVRFKVDFSNNTPIKIIYFIFEKEFYLDGFREKLSDDIDDFIKKNGKSMLENC